MIHITDDIAIDERETEESFVRASGPGGQNVNKLSTAVQLRFDVRRPLSLPDDVRPRVERLAGRRLTQEGVLIIIAQCHRTQERNRKRALERLVELIERSAQPPAPRRSTRPTVGAKRRRLEAKKQRAVVKKMRGAPPVDYGPTQGYYRAFAAWACAAYPLRTASTPSAAIRIPCACSWRTG